MPIAKITVADGQKRLSMDGGRKPENSACFASWRDREAMFTCVPCAVPMGLFCWADPTWLCSSLSS